ncbi:MAG TPA: hypothetical protein ENH29_10325 [Bacteroidetes bacterium]|nr:hypothetical protein [Bacteroidota bacterium]
MKLSWKILCVLFIFFLLIPVHSQAQEQQKSGKDSTVQILLEKVQRLEKRTQSLEAQQQQSELQKLREEAQTAAVEQSKEEKKTKVFRGGQRALQAINPEISVTGDFLSHYIAESPHHAGLERSGNNFRVLGLHFRSDLDPFSYTKIAVEIHPKGAELGEAYAVWSGQIPGFSFMAGKFRQQFGVVNRWHAHSLDQIFFPPAIQELFGPEGLNQTGFSIDWTLPKILPATQQFTVQMTNGQNEHLFSGEFYSAPAFLAHLKNYYDITRDVYFELGLSGMWGKNHVNDAHSLTVNNDAAPAHSTVVGGLDFTLFWEPLNRAHYRNFLWRSELFYVQKDLPLQEQLTAFGGYSYIQTKLGERWEIGVRGDWTQPFALGNAGEHIFQIVPYVTWWQSHWVRMRLEFQHRDGTLFTGAENRAWLQLTWAAGPHKHERY